VTHQGRTFYEGHPWREQMAMSWLTNTHSGYRAMTQIVPHQRDLQSYATECYDQPGNELAQYRPGDWIIHLPGVAGREGIIQRYLASA
jgi:hypothetical protein